MKKLIVILAAALCAANAFAADVEFFGEASVNLGYESVSEGGEDTSAIGVSDGSDDGYGLFGATIEEGKLTSEIAFALEPGGTVAADTAVFTYNFGPASLAYNVIGAEYAWNDDVNYISASANGSATVTALDMIFLTLYDTGEAGLEDTEAQTVPAFSVGGMYEFGPAAFTAGVAIDMLGDRTETSTNEETGEEVETTVDAYNALLGFASVDLTFGDFAAGLAFDYSQGASDLWIDTEVGGGEDNSIMGLYASVAYTMGNIEIGDAFGYSTVTDGNDDYTMMTLADVYVQYNVSDNFYVKPNAAYEVESSDAMDDDNTNMSVGVTAGFVF